MTLIKWGELDKTVHKKIDLLTGWTIHFYFDPDRIPADLIMCEDPNSEEFIAQCLTDAFCKEYEDPNSDALSDAKQAFIQKNCRKEVYDWVLAVIREFIPEVRNGASYQPYAGTTVINPDKEWVKWVIR